MSRIACIGTREVPRELQGVLKDIGRYLAQHGYIISTGNAYGADSLFAQGGNKINPAAVELHLPWRNYNSEQVMPGNKIFQDGDIPEYQELAAQLHSNWLNLKRGVQALHARNVGIIKGTASVIALPNWQKTGGGGTGMGLRIAKHYSIPIFDLTKPEVLNRIVTKISYQNVSLSDRKN